MVDELRSLSSSVQEAERWSLALHQTGMLLDYGAAAKGSRLTHVTDLTHTSHVTNIHDLQDIQVFCKYREYLKVTELTEHPDIDDLPSFGSVFTAFGFDYDPRTLQSWPRPDMIQAS